MESNLCFFIVTSNQVPKEENCLGGLRLGNQGSLLNGFGFVVG
jgi:hypothetical protein